MAPHRRLMDARIPWILPLLPALLFFSGCERKTEFVAPPPMAVTVARPVQQAVTDYAEYTGVVDAVESVEIRARVEGYLESVRFKPGARVKQGDLLFVIDPRPYQARLDEAKAELARRQAEMINAETILKRKELALQSKAVSELEAVQAKADHDVARAAVLAAQASLQTAELNLSYTRVLAPIGGRISRNMVDVGNLVGASERTLLATIVNDDPVYAYFNVNERDLLQYQQKQESPTSGNGRTRVFLGLSGQQGFPFEGRIDYVDNRLDRSTGTIQVRGVFSNRDRRLTAGLYARIQVPTGTRENALLVPESAVGTDQRGEYLLAVNAQNVVEYRQVTTGALVGDLRVIESGISPDDRIVVVGLQRARPGLTVAPSDGPASGSSQTAPR
ncbi:MAG: efflux RND transporter periplasmic adaptor subunit [Desulfobacteraceae bacterium]|nr:efflux RND transporter periplasmic adaptor subunit [Desulfobacteraceae bacterium]